MVEKSSSARGVSARLSASPGVAGTAEFVRRLRVAVPVQELFRWHARPGALERLTPPWSGARVESRTGGIETGARVVLRLPLGPFSVRWVAEHTDYAEGRFFRDEQTAGPFASWRHTHSFEADGADASRLEDRIEYALPGGWLGRAAGGLFVPRMLAQTFAYRHRITAGDLETHARYRGRAPLHFLVTGAGGLVGGALVPFLETGGHRVTRLGRRTADTAFWNPDAGVVDLRGLRDVDAVVHLAGESIASGRWSADVKRRIRDSRVRGTRLLCESLARLATKPRVLVSASAVGFYGDRGEAVVDEDAAAGEGFLADVCRDWEEATAPAAEAGIRVVHLRLGTVLSAAGGALSRLVAPFRLGLGGRLGSGRQYVSWIGIDDVVGAILHAAMTDGLDGAVNAVAPEPVTNADLTRTLAGALSRPALLPVPAFAARLAFGEMADAVLLGGARVVPARLAATGFRFRHPTLDDALRHTLGQAPDTEGER